MTEDEWLACTDPIRMLRFLRGKASDRKLRLFAVTCCQHFHPWSVGEQITQTIEVAGRYADGLATKAALRRARQRVWASRQGLGRNEAAGALEWVALWLAEVAASENAFVAMSPEIERLSGLGLLSDQDRLGEARLLRCIFGNPFRPVTIDPAWLSWNGGTLVKLAEAVYDDRAFDRLPILADALEESGCDNAEILRIADSITSRSQDLAGTAL